eukprot:g1450.t1
MPFNIQVDRHKSRPVAIKAKFPPLMPERAGTGSGTFMTSVGSESGRTAAPPQDLGQGGRALRLEDDSMRFARNANRLKAAIAEIDARTKKVQKGIARARRLRSTFGGQAAADTARRRETAQVNILEGNLSMWTMRNNDQEAINMACREKINQLRIELTALKRVFNEHASEMKSSDAASAELYKKANQIENLRYQARERLKLVVQAHEAEDAEMCKKIARLDAFINLEQKKAMGRIDEVLKMVPEKSSSVGEKTQDNRTNSEAEASEDKETGENETPQRAGWAPPKPANEAEYVELHSEEEFKEAFDALGNDLGLVDPGEIAKIFLSKEAEMFELFRETERIHEKIRLNRQDLKSINEKSAVLHNEQMQANAASAKKLAAMQERIDKTRVKNRYQENRLANIRLQFSKIADQMNNFFTSVGCDDMEEPNSSTGAHAIAGTTRVGASSASMRQYLGATVGESNIMKYLGVIESKAISILDLYKKSLVQEGVDVSAFSQFMPGPSRPHGGMMDHLKIDAPKMDIQFYTHNREGATKAHEKKLERVAGPVSPMSREAIMAELRSNEDGNGGKRRRKIDSNLLKVGNQRPPKKP